MKEQEIIDYVKETYPELNENSRVRVCMQIAVSEATKWVDCKQHDAIENDYYVFEIERDGIVSYYYQNITDGLVPYHYATRYCRIILPSPPPTSN